LLVTNSFIRYRLPCAFYVPARRTRRSWLAYLAGKDKHQRGDDRRIQLLDDLAQELHDATWAVDYPSFAEIHEEEGHVVLHALAEGTVRVSATIGQQTRYREIKIWPQFEALPVGTTKWGVHPIGREIRDLPAFPTGSGPHQ